MQKSIEQAVKILKAGGLVAFPTETVYGLGADATNSNAIQKIFVAKGRPVDHPLIVHLADIDQLPLWANSLSEAALKLAKAFWPGPLTLILNKNPKVLELVTGGQDSIGIRIPAHPVALALLTAMNTGLAAPSANRFGRISPTTATAVYEELADKVDLVLEGGECDVGLESTIVDARTEDPVILRPGMITQNQLEKVLKKPIPFQSKNKLRVSGNLESHYAPNTPLYLMTTEGIKNFILHPDATLLPCVILTRTELFSFNAAVEVVYMANQPNQYAHDLYQTLRALDHKNFKQIIVEKVPQEDAWMAVYDRLMRANYNHRE